MEKYSFLICVYGKDNPDFLKISIESMLSQTVSPDEIVLVEDGPLTPELYGVIEEASIAHPGVFNIVKNEKNLGLAKALNNGILHAKNELIARMDADDISMPERCELQLQAFEEQPDLDIIGTSTAAFDNDPEVITSVNHAAETPEAIYKRGKRRAAFSHVSVMYRKSTLLKYGLYGDYRRAQDTDLFCRMIYGGCHVRNLPQILVKVRKDDGMYRRGKSRQSLKCILKIRKNLWKIGYMSFADYLVLWFSYNIRAILPLSVQRFVYKTVKKKS